MQNIARPPIVALLAFLLVFVHEQLHAANPTRVPAWVQDAVFYQIFPERFRNGDPTNDPDHASLEDPDAIPESWKVTPWTKDWYARDDWERKMGADFYDHGVFHRRYGGDLQGIIDKLDYLKSLGINTIYLNPVFYARSMHKYDGNSFHHVDPHFGPDPKGDFELLATETADPTTWNMTAADQLFFDLVSRAHAKGIRIIIDGVFNHTGRDFFAFDDIRTKGSNSPYVSWYIIHSFDDPATPQNEMKYQCWWDHDTLPEFADSGDGSDLHPGPKKYIMQATRRWMDPNGDGDPSDGVDGWRLDVANEVPNRFWQDWNRYVRQINPQAYTVAEFWSDAGDYLRDCGFSAMMNYHGFAMPAKAFLFDQRVGATDFGIMIDQRMQEHPQDVRYALQNLLDSHDTPRAASMVVNGALDKNLDYIDRESFDYDSSDRSSPRGFDQYDISAPNRKQIDILKLAALLQMTSVGAPMIYYGTEVGMHGGDDPDDRMPMVWNDLKYENRTKGPRGVRPGGNKRVGVNSRLLDFFKGAIELRNAEVALRRGEFSVLATHDHRQLIAYDRTLGDDRFIIILNRGPKAATLQLPDGALSASASLKPVFATNGKPGSLRAVKSKNNVWSLGSPPRTGGVWKVTSP
ncbi:MAG: glycoside hydrolase family 13 protein [Pirellulales bacterium]|nr:glycoside hydrolase family 13 protein [Pirellulales bacterium]